MDNNTTILKWSAYINEGWVYRQYIQKYVIPGCKDIKNAELIDGVQCFDDLSAYVSNGPCPILN